MTVGGDAESVPRNADRPRAVGVVRFVVRVDVEFDPLFAQLRLQKTQLASQFVDCGPGAACRRERRHLEQRNALNRSQIVLARTRETARSQIHLMRVAGYDVSPKFLSRV